jgi:hypothetical protein
MKERPILFQGDMVRGVLEGQKTETRRVIKPQPYESEYEPGLFSWMKKKGISSTGSIEMIKACCPYGQIGDRLWVRETFAEVGTCDPGFLIYKATYPSDLPANVENIPDDIHEAGYKWKPSIFMPRTASRITLEITEISVERVQDITEEGALAEGVKIESGLEKGINNLAVARFADLWDSINKKRGFGWKSNPRVWVVKFKVVPNV